MNKFLEAALDKCTLCALRKSCKAPVRGDGDKGVEIMVIGEAPGAEEDLKDKPFIGASGQLLRGILKDVGLEGKVYITNAVKCRPPDNATPTVEQLDTCRRYLIMELATIKPTIIMAIGKSASKAVADTVAAPIPYKYMKSCVNQIYKIKYLNKNVYVVCLYHPSYILRKGKPQWMIDQIKESIGAVCTEASKEREK